MEELEARLKELETREERYDEELDGWHERYNRVREQLDHNKDLLERTREELTARHEDFDELETRAKELEGQVAAFEASRSDIDDKLAEVKARAVQKDRRIDELQRELDQMEYDLREAREELESFQDSMVHDNSEQRRLARESELLREVISDKENVIAELKLEIEDRSREIYDLKLGTGIKDLEEARRDVLEQFFEKNREADELKEKLRKYERQEEELRGEVDELEERLTEKRDVTRHPDFQRKQREIERIQEDLDEAKSDVERLEARLEAYGPEQQSKLEAEINFLERKNKALQDKLDSSQEDAIDLRAELREARTDGGPALAVAPAAETTGEINTAALDKARAREALVEVMESYSDWRSNLSLLSTYVDEAREAITEEGDVVAAVESLGELITVVLADARSMRSELGDLKELLGPGAD